jgi:hypothetical protein
MLTYLLAFGIPASPAAVGLAFGIAKDGSPFRRSWWSA